MPRTSTQLSALLLGLSLSAAGAGDWGTAAYRTTLLSAAAPHLDSARFVPLDGYRASTPQAGAGLSATVAARPELSLLSVALDTGVAQTLIAGDDPLTLLAPTDAAFAALPASQRQALRGDPEQLAGLLRAHLVRGHLTAQELADRAQVTTLDGQVLTVDREDGMRLGGGRVILADVAADGGVIHLVDRVLTMTRR